MATDITEAVIALARELHFEQPHSEQVTSLALNLFDELAEVHGFGDSQRQELTYAALLHDIGWLHGRRAHHKSSMHLILDDRQLPLPDRRRFRIAQIARYHRRSLPGDGHAFFQMLTPEDRHKVCILAGILRIADGLDRTHTNAVRAVRCRVSPKKLKIDCLTAGPAEAERLAAEKKADLLSLALKRSICIEMNENEK